MKVVYLHQYFKTPRVNGGVRSYHFARALSALGHDVHVVTSDPDPAAERGHTLELVDGLSVHRIAVPYDNTMGVRRRIVAFLSFAASSARVSRRLGGDVVVATSTPLTIALPALWAIALRPKTRFVFEVRDLWPAAPIEMGYLRNPVLKFVARKLERVTYRKADHIVALSDGMASGISESGVAEDKITVIPNIADIDAFRESDASQRTVFDDVPALSGRPIVLYSGTYGRVNGLDYMVELAIEAKKIGSSLAFVAIGTGVERDRVVEFAGREDVLGSSFFALDPVAKSELPNLLARSAFGSSWVIDIPILEHNSANKFFDTLAAGRPMLVNHGGWQAEVLQKTGAGWRLDRDAAKAVRLLEGIIGADEALDRAGEAAGRLADESYSLPILARRFTEVVTSGSRPAK